LSEQEASVVIAIELPEVEGRLRDVTRWSRFLVGVVEVIRTSHERYLFRLEDGREVRVAVRAHLRNHCFTWHALSGPPFEGSLRLSPAGTGLTRLTLQYTARPAGFVANLTEMVSRSRSRAMVDLHRLDSYVHAEAS
jgi:hypothetical protein